MNLETTRAIEAMFKIAAAENDGRAHYPYRASDAIGCARKTYFHQFFAEPIGPNQWSQFQNGHACEDKAQKIVEAMGFSVGHYHPDGQRGAHDAPDAVWTWGKKKGQQAIVHLDRVCTEKMTASTEFLNLKGVEPPPYGQSGVRDLRWGIIEVKNPDKYSYDRMKSDGPKDGYLSQMVAQDLALAESGYRPDFFLHLVINNSVKVDCRSPADALGEPPPLLVGDYEDVCQAWLFTQSDMDGFARQFVPMMRAHWQAVYDGLERNKEPDLQDEIMGQPRIARTGTIKHWMCLEYCPFNRMCYDEAQIEKDVGTRKRGADFAAKRR